MYSLTIHFGPNAMFWSFLLKEKENAEKCYGTAVACINDGVGFIIADDFGQKAVFKAETAHGAMLEDMEIAEEARIYRSLANARGEIKARQRAATDPVIRSASQGPSVIQPNFRAQ
jgi:hypothetical protein